MQDHTEFSFQVRLVIARLARMMCKYEGTRTALSNEHQVIQLIQRAARTERAGVQSVVDELFYLMDDEELQYLADRPIDLPAAWRGRLPERSAPVSSRGRPRRIYRGQVVEE